MQRQQIPHQIYKDATGVEHVRVRTCLRKAVPACSHARSLLLGADGAVVPVAPVFTAANPPPPPHTQQLQFNMRGPGGVALVNADMYKDGSGSWDFMYLIVDVRSGNSPPQRLNIIAPRPLPLPTVAPAAGGA